MGTEMIALRRLRAADRIKELEQYVHDMRVYREALEERCQTLEAEVGRLRAALEGKE